MAPVPTAQPGDMTVSPLFGWGDIVAVLLAVVAVALVFLVIGAAWSAVRGRSDLQAWLDSRSGRSAELPD